MKHFFVAIAAMLTLSVLVSSCSKDGEKGDPGPTGPTGPSGAAGPAGPAGPTGNANVVQYNFNGFTHTGSDVFKTFALTREHYERSLLYTFVGHSTYWYPIPGFVNNSTNEYRTYFSSPNTTTTGIYLKRASGTGNQVFTGMRIFAVRSNSVVNAGDGRSMQTIKTPDGKSYTENELRLMSYDSFCNALGIHRN